MTQSPSSRKVYRLSPGSRLFVLAMTGFGFCFPVLLILLISLGLIKARPDNGLAFLPIIPLFWIPFGLLLYQALKIRLVISAEGLEYHEFRFFTSIQTTWDNIDRVIITRDNCTLLFRKPVQPNRNPLASHKSGLAGIPLLAFMWYWNHGELKNDLRQHIQDSLFQEYNPPGSLGYYSAYLRANIPRVTVNRANIEKAFDLGKDSLRAAFVAMEYWGLMLNRTFVILAKDQMLCGAKVHGISDAPITTHGIVKWLDLRFYLNNRILNKYRGVAFTSAKFLSLNRMNFQIPRDQIAHVEFDATLKWGMGNVIHSGKIYVTLKNGKKREFILLADQNGDDVRRELTNFVSAR